MVWYPAVFDTTDANHVISVFKNKFIYNKEMDTFFLKVNNGEMRMNLEMQQGDLMPLGREGVIDASYLNGGSYYYSVPNLKTSGTIAFGGNKFEVSGMTWYDHQWGNFPLSNMAWQWFSLRLNRNNLYIMIFNFTDSDRDTCFGNIQCGVESMQLTDIKIVPIEIFGLKNGKTCPIAWNIHLAVKEGALNFNIKALVKNQFINSVITPSFWEGMCSAEGEACSDISWNTVRWEKGEKMSGSAYVEITGLG